MKEIKFRTLNANEIDVRVARYTESGKAMLLLYKDARVDQNLLDEAVGPMNWQRSHSRDNANCIVSIWDDDKHQWVSKEDTGTESNTEKEKGLASDSFKRACFNWGIGRELYTAPTIFVPGKKNDYVSYKVSEIDYDDKRNINRLVITDDKGTVLYTMGKPATQPKPTQPKATTTKTNQIVEAMKSNGVELLQPRMTVDQVLEVAKRCKTFDDLKKLHAEFISFYQNDNQYRMVITDLYNKFTNSKKA